VITVEVAAAVLIALSVVFGNSEPLILASAGAAVAGSLCSTWVAVRAVQRRPEPDGLKPDLRVTPPPAARSPSR
jgi:hypothetical protein